MPEVVEWISPAGVITPLNVEYAVRGRFAPPSQIFEETVPGQPGARVREVLHTPREFVLPLRIGVYTTEAELRAALRTLVREMDPTFGEGRVRVSNTPAGDARETRCRYTGGLGIDEVLGETSMPTWTRAAVSFRGHDPYWYATSLTVMEFGTGATPSFFPFFPLRLSSSEVFADVTVDNPGDIGTWPVWEIDGPGGSPIAIRHLGTGQVTSLDTTLLTGQTITIDTRPGAKTVTRDDGTNLYPNLSLTSSLWPLLSGANAVRVEMGGATDDSRVRLRYQPAYLSP